MGRKKIQVLLTGGTCFHLGVKVNLYRTEERKKISPFCIKIQADITRKSMMRIIGRLGGEK